MNDKGCDAAWSVMVNVLAGDAGRLLDSLFLADAKGCDALWPVMVDLLAGDAGSAEGEVWCVRGL